MFTHQLRLIVTGAVALCIYGGTARTTAQEQRPLLIAYFDFSDYALKEANKDPKAVPLILTSAGDVASASNVYGAVVSSPVYRDPKDPVPRGFMVKGQFVETVPDGDLFRSTKKYVSNPRKNLIYEFMYEQGGKEKGPAFDKVITPTGASIVFDGRSKAGTGPVTLTKLFFPSCCRSYVSAKLTSAPSSATTSGVHFLGSYQLDVDGPTLQANGLFLSPERKFTLERVDVPTERDVLTQVLPKINARWRGMVEARLKELPQ